MVEFAINTSVNTSTGYSPFFLNGGHTPRMICDMWKLREGVPGVADFVHTALRHLMDAHDALIASREFQIVYANQLRSNDPLLKDGDMVYLSTKNLNASKGRARKLILKYIGPYQIIQCFPTESNYKLDLPEDLRERRINPMFHISVLRHSSIVLMKNFPTEITLTHMTLVLPLMQSSKSKRSRHIIGRVESTLNLRSSGTMVMLLGSH